MILIRHGQTEFNRVYSETRRDPGIRDPQLTAVGRSQAAAVARALGATNPSRLITSPYTRALETAEIIAGDLGLPISVEPLLAERFAFTCDIGSPLATLRARWPDIAFDHLPDPWWPLQEESVEALSRRSEIFCSRIAQGLVQDRCGHTLGLHQGRHRAQGIKRSSVADRPHPA